MARALRMERLGGRFHVTARGNERKAINYGDSDRAHFLELLAEATRQFGIRGNPIVQISRRDPNASFFRGE